MSANADSVLPQDFDSCPPPGDLAAATEPAPAAVLPGPNADTCASGRGEQRNPDTSGVRAGAGEVGRLHGDFVTCIANERPARIVGGLADPADVEERRYHLEHILKALNSYVTAIVDDLNANLPVTETIDLADWSGLLSDITADHLSAPLSQAAQALGDARYGDGGPPRRFGRRRSPLSYMR